jgi:outer membrane protein OmpA-like peptidoglycan-associated protein
LGQVARQKEQKMKLSKFTNLLVMAVTLSVAVSACKKRPGMVTPLPGSMTKNVNDIGPGGGLGQSGLSDQDLNKTPLEQVDPGVYENYNRDPEMFKQDTVYFAFDSSAVRAAEQPSR